MVLALLTLSSDGCRSLHRHKVAAERLCDADEREDKHGGKEGGKTFSIADSNQFMKSVHKKNSIRIQG